MNWPLVLAGLALGFAATPHCAAMCGAPCTALTRGATAPAVGFLVGRAIGYALAGALAASSMAALAAWSQAAPALRPLWTLLHLALLGLGLCWMVTGRQLAWMRRDGAVPVPLVGARARPLRATLAGLAWVAWPCAALQGALLLAALASNGWGGALVMAAFALGSMPGLLVGPWALARWQAWRGVAPAPGQVTVLGFRVAGGALVIASAWALTHGLWARVAAWCFG